MIEKSLAFLEDVALAELRFRTSKNSHIPNRGIYLPWPHSKLVSEGNEKVILKNRKYNVADMDFLYCDNKFAYGILKIGDSKKVATREEFTELRKFYKLTDSESKDWDRSKPLFVYPIKEVHNFDSSIQMNLPKEIHNFIVSPIQYLELGDKYPFTKKELPSNPARPVIPFPIQLKCPNCGEWIDVPHQPIPQKCPKCGGEIWKEAFKNLIKSTALSKEEYEEIVKGYNLKPLPDKYYKSSKKGDFWAQCIGDPQVPIYTRDGWIRYVDLSVGDEVLTHKGRFRKITKKNKFEYKRSWYKIFVKFNGIRRKLRVTDEHPFLTSNGWKLAPELKLGDTILSMSNSNCKECGKPIPIRRGWGEDYWDFCSKSCATKYQHKENGQMFGNARIKLDKVLQEKIKMGIWGFQDKRKAREACIEANKVLAKQRISYPHKRFIELINKYNIDYEIEYPLKTCGHTFYADVAIPELKIDFEIDGKRHHDKNRDAKRDFLINSIGWKTIRMDANLFTPKSKNYNIEKVETIIKNTLYNDMHKFQFAECIVDDIEIIQYTEEHLKKRGGVRLKWAYNIEVEEDHSYCTPNIINHNCHIRGVLPEDYEEYKKGNIPLWKAIHKHSMHVDLRCSFPGLARLLQFVLVEDSIDSYLRVMKGSVDPKSNQVSKGLIVIKPSAMEPSERLKKDKEEKKEMLLDEAGAKKIANLIIDSKSYWIEPGGIGATKDKYAYMGAIVLGKIESGTMREDFKELFLYAEGTNNDLWNGRFIFKAFEKPRHLWWSFKAIKTPTPCNPFCEIDSGNFKLLPADRLKYFKKEDYSEWKTRKDKC